MNNIKVQMKNNINRNSVDLTCSILQVFYPQNIFIFQEKAFYFSEKSSIVKYQNPSPCR